MQTFSFARAVCFAAFVLLANELAAQLPCARVWQPGQPLAGVDGSVGRAVSWDPDGPGPQNEQVVVAGRFTIAGAVAASNIAVYDPVLRTWSALPGAPFGDVQALASDAAGRLFAEFGTDEVMQWTGAGWQPFALPLPGTIHALFVLPNGDLVVGGDFGLFGIPLPGNGIVRWDGAAWQSMGIATLPTALGRVDRFASLPNGDLLAAGSFTSIGGVACNFVARWDGVAWHALGAGAPGRVFDLLATANGDVLVAASVPGAPGTSGLVLVRFDGTTWTALAGTVDGRLVAPYGPDGALIAMTTGLWLHQPSGLTLLAPWSNAGLWRGVNLPGGDLLVAGDFADAGGTPAANVARWNGSAWSAVSAGTAGAVAAMTTDRDGSVLAVGEFSGLAGTGTATTRLARFDGTTWTPLPLPAKGTLVAARPNGEVVVAGEFVAPGGAVARLGAWRNGVFTPIAPGSWANGSPVVLAVAANGDVLVGAAATGQFLSSVGRWDGTTLVSLPITLVGTITAILELDGGDLLIGGSFFGPSLMRWNGTQLASVPGAPSFVTALAHARNGDVLVGTGLVHRFDGNTWQTVGQTLGLPFGGGVLKILELPDSSLVVSVRSGSAAPTGHVLRWNGATWDSLATTVGTVALAWSEAGELLIGGAFAQTGGLAQAVLVRLGTTCPAGVVDRSGGCAGAAGPILQSVERRAWLGGQLGVRTRSIANGGLAVAVFGFTPTSLPLPLVHPLGTAGCTLLAAADIILPVGVQAGEALVSLAVPQAAALLGAAFEQQTVVCETTASGDLAALFTSNALSLTIGSW